MQYVFGVDLGGTTVELGLVTVSGELLAKLENDAGICGSAQLVCF